MIASLFGFVAMAVALIHIRLLIEFYTCDPGAANGIEY
jgi:hypothetical protein